MPLFHSATSPISLALQGGGAHGAFTWGVLDALLAHGAHPIGALSGASAGAMNAVVLAHGWLDGGAEGARAALSRFWTAAGTRLPFEWFTTGAGDAVGLTPAARALMQWTRYLSPYQFNPLDLNPLRDLLAEQVDFTRLRAGTIELFIAATHANSGRLRVFRTPEISADAVLASACLPTLHHAIEIDGQPYWDGGYAANPALFPLIVNGGLPADLLIVMLSPHVHAHAPRSAPEIHERTLEIAFNATFLREARLLGEAHAVARRSWLPAGTLERRLRRMRFHLIDAHDQLGALRAETRLIAHLPFLERLRDLGRERARAWLGQHGASIGRRATVDLLRTFGPDVPRPRSVPADGPGDPTA